MRLMSIGTEINKHTHARYVPARYHTAIHGDSTGSEWLIHDCSVPITG